ncbi:MAG: hypothetical protein WD039_05460 [Xanthobacteraceae bacterium]
MFKISEKPTFTHVVKVLVPVDGGHREDTLRATYRVLPIDEVKKIDLDAADGATAFLRAVIEKLDDIADHDGNAMVYSDELRDRVIALPYCRAALAQGYFDAVSKAKAGN